MNTGRWLCIAASLGAVGGSAWFALRAVRQGQRGLRGGRGRFLREPFAVSESALSKVAAPDWALLDRHLERLERFVEGDTAVATLLSHDLETFNAHLTRALEQDAARASGPLTAYTVMLLGVVVPAESPVGRALLASPLKDLPDARTVEGVHGLFAADLWQWFEGHRVAYVPCPAYERWRTSAVATRTVIPMYRAVLGLDQDDARSDPPPASA